jgi:hypothetical protein
MVDRDGIELPPLEVEQPFPRSRADDGESECQRASQVFGVDVAIKRYSIPA